MVCLVLRGCMPRNSRAWLDCLLLASALILSINITLLGVSAASANDLLVKIPVPSEITSLSNTGQSLEPVNTVPLAPHPRHLVKQGKPIIGTPPKMITILLGVSERMIGSEYLSGPIRKVMVVVKKLLENMNKEPSEPTLPPGRTTVTVTTTDKETAPPPPTTTEPAPPPPTTTEPALPPPTTTVPAPPPPTSPPGLPTTNRRPCSPCHSKPWPPGSGHALDDDNNEAEVEEAKVWTSGFVRVTRRTVETYTTSDATNDDIAIATGSTGTHGDDIMEQLLDMSQNSDIDQRRPLTRHDRAFMRSEAKKNVIDALGKEHIDHPDDPAWAVVNKKTCMKLFKDLSKKAEQWLVEHPSANPEDGIDGE